MERVRGEVGVGGVGGEGGWRGGRGGRVEGEGAMEGGKKGGQAWSMSTVGW